MDINQTKAVYVQPSLQRLGSIGSLTAGGTIGALEGMMMTNMMMSRS
jgi:hypothetical protein